jgi:hypothetical protein
MIGKNEKLREKLIKKQISNLKIHVDKHGDHCREKRF